MNCLKTILLLLALSLHPILAQAHPGHAPEGTLLHQTEHVLWLIGFGVIIFAVSAWRWWRFRKG